MKHIPTIAMVNRPGFLLPLVLGSACFGACSSKSHDAPLDASSGAGTFTLTTPDIVVAAGEEKYVCFAKTLDEDVAVDRFDLTANPVVHHVFFSRTLAPEPDGLSECNVIFKQTWLPMFVTGKGSTSLEYPAGAASVLHKGSQVVLQLHLLNPQNADVHTSGSVTMRISTAANPDPVAIYAFGTQQILLPPEAKSDVVNLCTPTEDIEAFATLAHLHKLGTALHFSVEQDDGTMKEVVNRDPYSFDNQYIDPTPITVPKGKKTQITCSYNNTTANKVTFGESSLDEMCYLVGYIRGKEGAFGCTGKPFVPDDGGASDADAADTAPANCKPAANSIGVGGACTAGGNECKNGLSCSTDLSSSSGAGFCVKLGCASATDCGGDATCCSPSQGGGVKVCLPASCVPSDCVVSP